MLKRLLRFLGLAVFIFSLFALGYVSNNFISRNDAPQYQEVANPADYLFLLDEKIDFAVEGYGGRRGSLGVRIEDILNDPAGWGNAGLNFDFDVAALRYKYDGIEPDYGELGVEIVFYLAKDEAEIAEFCGPNGSACVEKKTEYYTPMFNAPCLIILNLSRYVLKEFRNLNLDFHNIGGINHEVGHCLGLHHGKYGAVSKHGSSQSAYPARSEIQAVEKARWSLIDELGYDYVNGKGFGEDGIGVAIKDDKEFHIFPDGGRLYEEEYDYVSFGFYDGISIARENDKYFHITMDGEPLYKERYDYIRDFKEGLAVTGENGKYFHITMDGEPLYKERYYYVRSFKEGLARVYNNRDSKDSSVFLACINKQGEVVSIIARDC